MEILQNIWTILTSQNEILVKLIVMPTTFIEITLSMLIFTTFFNIKTSKTQKIKYIISITIFAILSLAFIPQPFNTFINIIVYPIYIYFFLRTTLLKSILSEFLSLLITAILESLIGSVSYNLFGIALIYLATIPIYRVMVVTILYVSMFLLYLVIKHTKFNIHMLDYLPANSKLMFVTNFVVAIFVMGFQFYLIYFYSDAVPPMMLLFSILMLLSYLCISIYSMYKNSQLLLTEKDLENSKLYNRTLMLLHDDIRAFKHDFNNIVQAIRWICCN